MPDTFKTGKMYCSVGGGGWETRRTEMEIGKKITTGKQQNYPFGPDNPRRPYFYLVSKLPKPPNTWTIPFEVVPGRLMVSDCNRCHISHFTIHWSLSACAPIPFPVTVKTPTTSSVSSDPWSFQTNLSLKKFSIKIQATLDLIHS